VAERSEAGWGITQRVVDCHQDAFEIPIEFIVPEAQDPEPVAGEVMVTLCIT
jgi:hypothetical protein